MLDVGDEDSTEELGQGLSRAIEVLLLLPESSEPKKVEHVKFVTAEAVELAVWLELTDVGDANGIPDFHGGRVVSTKFGEQIFA